MDAGGSAIDAAKNKKYFFLVDIKIHAANPTNEVLIWRGLMGLLTYCFGFFKMLSYKDLHGDIRGDAVLTTSTGPEADPRPGNFSVFIYLVEL